MEVQCVCYRRHDRQIMPGAVVVLAAGGSAALSALEEGVEAEGTLVTPVGQWASAAADVPSVRQAGQLFLP